MNAEPIPNRMIRPWTLALLAIVACVLGLGQARAQQTRSSLETYNNQYIFSNGQGEITGPIVNTLNGFFINSAGMLVDINHWTGTNTYSINPQWSACVGVPVSTGSAPFTCSLLPPSALAVGAAATNLGMSMPTAFGATCDGNPAHVDTSYFNQSIAAAGVILTPPEVRCVVANLVITDNQTLDCQGSILQAAPGALWIIKKTGFNSKIRNCAILDSNYTTIQTTTLNGDVSPGTTVIPVNSTTGFAVNMIASIQLASGAYWTDKIVSVNPGVSITINDPIPYTLTGVSVNTGGTGYATTVTIGSPPFAYIHEGTLIGGSGPTATVKLTTSGGGITAATIDTPGMWQTSPGSTAAVFDPRAPAAFNGVLNLTVLGASNGGFVDAAFGEVIDDNAVEGDIEDLTISEAGVGLEILGSSITTENESIRSINVGNARIAGMAKLDNVLNNSFREIRVAGSAHHASSFGAVGLYVDGRASNKFDIVTLGFEIGLLDLNGTTDLFEHVVFDTSRNYAVACIGCNTNSFTYLWAAFTGSLSNPAGGSIGGQGIGLAMSSSGTTVAVNNAIGQLLTDANASDIHMGDASAAVTLNNLSWSISKYVTGSAYRIMPGYQLMNIPTSPDAFGISSTIYLAPGLVSTTQNVGSASGIAGDVTSMTVYGPVAPGGGITYTAFLWWRPWLGSDYGSWAAVGSCSWSGTTTKGCSTFGSATPINQQDQLGISITPSSGAFPSGETFSGFVNGL